MGEFPPIAGWECAVLRFCPFETGGTGMPVRTFATGPAGCPALDLHLRQREDSLPRPDAAGPHSFAFSCAQR